MNWITGTSETDGVKTHYLRTGGDKPPVVLLHGLMLNGACWIPLARMLEKEYDVVMPDARGHGYSSVLHQGYRYNNLAMDVIHLIDTLELINPILIGHSMGGLTALLVASLQREQLRGLILADPTFLSPERQQEVFKSDVKEQHRHVLKHTKENYLAEILVRHRHRTREINQLFTEARFQTSIHALDILTPPNPDYIPLIQQLDIPSLLVIGDTNPVVSMEMAQQLARRNRHLNIIQIKQAGHAIPYDQPEHFATVIQTFLRTIFDE